MKKKILLLLAILGAGGLWLALSWGSDYFLRRPNAHFDASINEPATEAFSALNPAGQRIFAWWYQGKPEAPVILLCHGHSVSHEQLGGIFSFLRKRGFSLLMLDFRAHGKSEGEYTSIGLYEGEDIETVIREAEKRGFINPTTPLAAYGRSMGAVALANGAKKLHRIQVFILESMYPELRTIAGHDAEGFHLPDGPLVDFFWWYCRLKTGIPYLESRPSERLPDIFPRPLLLIQDGKDQRVRNEDFQRMAGIASWGQTMVFPDARHVGGHSSEPEKFERGILGFLASAGIPLP